MGTAELRQNLEGILYDWAKDKYPIAFENVAYTAQKKTYLETHLLPAQTAVQTWRTNRLHGIFQITVYAPQGKSAREADEIAERIMALYPVGTNQIIRITAPPYRSQGRYVNAWYAVTVSISYAMEV